MKKQHPDFWVESSIFQSLHHVVAVGLVDEVFQHPSHFTPPFPHWRLMMPESLLNLHRQPRHLFIHTFACIVVDAFISADLFSFIHLVIDLFRHPTVQPFPLPSAQCDFELPSKTLHTYAHTSHPPSFFWFRTPGVSGLQLL